MSSDYPTRDSFAFMTTGSQEGDERQLDLIMLRERRMAEGICPNGCGPMRLVDAYTQECTVCPFTGHSNVPIAPYEGVE